MDKHHENEKHKHSQFGMKPFPMRAHAVNKYMACYTLTNTHSRPTHLHTHTCSMTNTDADTDAGSTLISKHRQSAT